MQYYFTFLSLITCSTEWRSHRHQKWWRIQTHDKLFLTVSLFTLNVFTFSRNIKRELKPYDTSPRNFKKGTFYPAAQARVPINQRPITFESPKGVMKIIRRKQVMYFHKGSPIQSLSIRNIYNLIHINTYNMYLSFQK